jgi:hypothetical protein
MAEKTKDQVRDELIVQINKGLMTTEAERIAYIRRELGLPDDEAARYFFNTVVKPQLNEFQQPSPGSILEQDPLGPASRVGRDPLLQEQQERAQYLRGILGATGRAVGGFGPLSQRALRTSFGRFSDIDPITRETRSGGLGLGSSEPGMRFQDFLTGSQATPQSLAASLTGHAGSVGPGSGPVEDQAFRDRYARPGDALRAALQPYLLTVNPRRRNAAAEHLLNMIEPQISMNPQSFESSQQMAAMMQEILAKTGFNNQTTAEEGLNPGTSSLPNRTRTMFPQWGNPGI